MRSVVWASLQAQGKQCFAPWAGAESWGRAARPAPDLQRQLRHVAPLEQAAQVVVGDGPHARALLGAGSLPHGIVVHHRLSLAQLEGGRGRRRVWGLDGGQREAARRGGGGACGARAGRARGTTGQYGVGQHTQLSTACPGDGSCKGWRTSPSASSCLRRSIILSPRLLYSLAICCAKAAARGATQRSSGGQRRGGQPRSACIRRGAPAGAAGPTGSTAGVPPLRRPHAMQD